MQHFREPEVIHVNCPTSQATACPGDSISAVLPSSVSGHVQLFLEAARGNASKFTTYKYDI